MHLLTRTIFKKSFEEALDSRKITKDEILAFDLTLLFWMAQAHRYYIYGAVPETSEPQDWIRLLRATDKCVFRSGKLTVKSNRRKQQGVDVMLALEAQRNAYLKHCNCCILFSCDGDFLPLVEAVVDSGTKMVVVSFGHPEKSEVARQLRDAADSYIHIGSQLLWSAIRQGHRFSGISSESLVNLRSIGQEVEILLDPKSTKSVLLPDGKFYLIKDEPINSDIEFVRIAMFNSRVGAEVYFKLNGALDW